MGSGGRKGGIVKENAGRLKTGFGHFQTASGVWVGAGWILTRHGRVIGDVGFATQPACCTATACVASHTPYLSGKRPSENAAQQVGHSCPTDRRQLKHVGHKCPTYRIPALQQMPAVRKSRNCAAHSIPTAKGRLKTGLWVFRRPFVAEGAVAGWLCNKDCVRGLRRTPCLRSGEVIRPSEKGGGRGRGLPVCPRRGRGRCRCGRGRWRDRARARAVVRAIRPVRAGRGTGRRISAGSRRGRRRGRCGAGAGAAAVRAGSAAWCRAGRGRGRG